jgi:hypothetical protein
MFDNDKKTGFSNEGFRIRRLNPDGSYPTVDNHLGFAGTIDTSELLGTEKLSYRWNGKGDFSDITVDLKNTGLVVTAATVAEVVTALNLIEAFSGVFTASADSGTGRLKIADKVAESTYTYLELKGDVAIILGFGASGDAVAVGTAFVEAFDESAAISLPKNIRDGEEIDQESGTGKVDTIMIDAVLKGINPSIALVSEMYELKVVLMGGSWDDTEKEYTPPTTDLAVAPLCACEIFVAKYGKGSQHRGDMTGYKMYKINRMTGREGDVSHDVKTWASQQIECVATEYIVAGVKYPAYIEKELTIAQAVTMGIAS